MDERRYWMDFEEEEEDGEGWLTSYSDMVTDLLAIFVLLFAFAMLNQGVPSASRDAVSLYEGGAGIFGADQGILALQNGQRQEGRFTETKIDALILALAEHIEKGGLSGRLSVSKTGDSIALLRVSDSVLFDSGRAVIKAEANPILADIANILETYEDLIKMVRIEGHTDDRPIRTAQFNSNWELSTVRAVNVLRHLLDTSALPPEKLSAVGLSEFHPIAENDTSEGMAQNRRVDFIIEAVPVDGGG